ncbi:MAG: serine/threonine-protein kinase [Nannocystaceae bacterium]
MTEHEQNKTIVAAGSVPQPTTGEYAAIPVAPDLIGTVLLGRYKVLSHIGDGGMGSVYMVEHTTIFKKSAVKILSAALSTRQDYVDRFLREARAASAINHPNVVEITDFGQAPTGAPFFVMEYLQGEDLSETIAREGAMTWNRVKPIILQICGALEAAHAQGIVHRDMKPGNVLRIKHGNNSDYVKVLDFGIAKVQSLEASERSLTQTGTVIGTPEYMSPEQGWGHPVDHRSDIYAVGVILYELLTGQVPFTGETMMEVLNRHIYEVPNIDHPHITQEIGAIILKAMQKDRAFRFQSMTDMVEAIDAVGTGAEPVKVVDEEIKAPWGPVTARYTTAVTKITMHEPSTVSKATTIPGAPEVESRRRGGGAVIGLIAAGVAAIGVIAFVIFGNGDEPETKPAGDATPLPVVAPPTVDKPDEDERPEPPPVVIEAGAERVSLKVSTPGVSAQILDARDEAIYGMTNSPEGIEVKKGSDPIKLVLRAKGYEDLEMTVVPEQDRAYEKSMVKEKGRAPTTKVKKKTGETPTGETPPPATTNGGSGGGSDSSLPEIKNPFAKKG